MLIFKSIKILKPLCNFFIRFEDSINQYSCLNSSRLCSAKSNLTALISQYKSAFHAFCHAKNSAKYYFVLFNVFFNVLF